MTPESAASLRAKCHALIDAIPDKGMLDTWLVVEEMNDHWGTSTLTEDGTPVPLKSNRPQDACENDTMSM